MKWRLINMAVKRNLSLKELKNDTSEKHKKIYNKAMYIINKGFHSPTLSYMELKLIAENFRSYGLSVSVAISGDMTVRSKCDDWTIIDEGRFYVLYHELTVVGVNGKARKEVHVQDVFEDLNFLFASIVKHDDFKMNIFKNKIEEDIDGDINTIRGIVASVTSLEKISYKVSNYAC